MNRVKRIVAVFLLGAFLLCDVSAGVIGAIHCGWRSSVADILGNALNAMKSLGASPSTTCAAIGPAIGKCCFETDDDVPDAIEKWLCGDTEGLFRRRPDGKTLVDLRGANARRLRQLGLPVQEGIYTLEEAKQELLALAGKGGKRC